ncbi:MAG: polyphosphate polymerase domain-containing protein [Ruminococcaceae bacterium]|nr:polyphosphate polymerase domain-containing protein [Oscillospiraceae bacterium]
MKIQTNFNRYETKYLITAEQQKAILEAVKEHIKPDEFGKSTICNVYYDTPDYLLIRRSLESPMYKEKLRLRSYGVANKKTPVFLEIKKKYNSVVYKRRIVTTQSGAKCFINKTSAQNTQIANEIKYFIERYKNLQPAVFISYEREAFYDKSDDTFRITFDKNILWRDWDISLSNGIYGNPILGRNQALMEVKCAGAIPMWFTKILSENGIYKTSFSKYGRAYQSILRRNTGEKKYA